MSILVDFNLIFRVLLAFSWGCAWAAYIQFNRYGKFLALERTWITVVVGIGVDLLISYPWLGSYSDWYTTALVISFSSLGIIARSLHNESKEAELNTRSYKVIWGIEDAISLTSNLTEGLLKLLEYSNQNPESVKAISKLLAASHKLTNVLRAARKGDYSQKMSK